ncbi:rhomboid family protein [Oceanicola granulosus HTCC2516]|uniref:Rhomboid family protein n=1 Tax=Oceanicola granulosus (strain ATCC BAA-861 / DSM 15982 / KCTC 12143 / HTCC2516) TaxID=314256 RepID=Q2CBQ0_OCEGH|nr:rhomboid family intramembrane serine protease [Oceanicola granulosus]EAR50081.1 rhomboid family protein [Oceanicola granulosus HTCC2516]
MFPIRDHNPSEQTPYVVYALIAINVAVYLYGLVALTTDQALWEFYIDYAMFPVLITEGVSYSGLVTHMFLHGGFMHILGNMLFLWIFGDNLEEEMGHVGFLLFYLASGLGAGLAQYAGEPLSQIPMVGASGAIAGVMGGYLLLYPKAKVDVLLILIVIFRIIPVPAWLMLGVWFALQVFNGVGADLSAGGTAYWAHAGGFVIGLVLTLPVWIRRGAAAFWGRTDGHPPHPAARYRTVRTSVPVAGRRRGVSRSGSPWKRPGR